MDNLRLVSPWAAPWQPMGRPWAAYGRKNLPGTHGQSTGSKRTQYGQPMGDSRTRHMGSPYHRQPMGNPWTTNGHSTDSP